jgi:hypothetical protein
MKKQLLIDNSLNVFALILMVIVLLPYELPTFNVPNVLLFIVLLCSAKIYLKLKSYVSISA